ncbi:MAG: SPOR domain-containing protein [Candidatus Omnitrophica bacterium]|nr:SPOR domain-containing protein [Candidatus Omnitrophota bacterium]
MHKFKITILLTFIFSFFLLTFFFCFSYAEADIARAQRLLLEEKYDDAVREADSLIDARSRKRDEVYYIKGLSELKLSRFNDARQSFERIISKYRRSGRLLDAYTGIGDSYFLEGRTDKALVSYNDAVNKFPDDKNISVIYYRIADCYRKAGSGDKADEYYNKAGRLSPLGFETRGAAPAASVVKRAEYQPAGSARRFSIQTGSFKNKRNAEKFRQKLSDQGYDARVEAYSGSGDGLYRVKVGGYSSKDEAASAASKLKRNGYNTSICDYNTCQ